MGDVETKPAELGEFADELTDEALDRTESPALLSGSNSICG